MTALADSVLAACARWPDRPALTHGAVTLSYGEVGERVRALAAAYRGLGVRPGDRVVCQLAVRPEHLVAAAAAWACGAVHVGADKDLTGPELSALVERTGAAALVYQAAPGASEPLAPLRAVRAAHPDVVAIVNGQQAATDEHDLSRLMAGAGQPPEPSPRDDDTDLLLSTSGTTGEPKLVCETVRALWAKVRFFAEAVSPTPDDVHLMFLPVAHVFGLKLSLMALASGGHLVLLDRFAADAALRLVEQHAVTVLAATPTHLKLLLHALDGHRVDSLRWIATAAAPLSPGVVAQVYHRLGVELLSVYGCSEGFLVRTTDRDDIRRGAVGTTVFKGPEGTPPDGTVRILDPERDVPLPAGRVGEIAFGAARPVRYWPDVLVARDGLYRSGDLGRVDGDGRLYVSGRLKEVVNRGGLKVAAAEIEAVLRDCPGVADAAIVPTPDPILGEAICACVVPAGDSPPTLADVRAHLAQRLARHKLPDELCVVDAIPYSKVGKVNRALARTLVVDGGLPRTRLRPREPAAEG